MISIKPGKLLTNFLKLNATLLNHRSINKMSKCNCIFCDIITDDKNKITYEDELVVVFPDIKPASESHFLIVSKQHILNAKELLPSQLDLLQHMISVGKEMLADKQSDETRFGFHWPPFTSIQHLHLHAIAPVSQMSFISRLIFKENSWWFVSPDYVLSRLEELQNSS